MKKTLFLTLLSAALLTACGGSETPASPAAAASTAAVAANPDRNPAWQTYIVGSQLTYPPFHYQDEKGEPIGFEMELLKAVAKAGEFNITVQHAPRNTLEETLNNGSIQIWSSTVSISPERAAQMDFSQPFMYSDRDVIYIQDTEANKAITDLAHFKGKKLAVNEFSSSAKETATKLTGSEANVVVTKSYYLSMKELFAGNVDGVLDNGLVLANYTQSNPSAPKTRSILVAEEKKDFAFAVKKGNTEILDKLNKGLEKVKADGTYQKLVEKWFGNEQI